MPVLALILVAALAAVVAAAMVPLLMPWLRRIALAKVNERSSHHVPTPQGGGLAILAGMASALICCWALGWTALSLAEAAALLGMAALGFIDDIQALPASKRIVAQALFLLIPFLPLAQVPPFLVAWSPLFNNVALRLALVVAGFVGLLWIVNLTNFMDGLDGLIAAAYAPGLLAGGSLLVLLHGEPFGLVALAAGGALLGFAVWNWNPAKIFMGDAGSLLIGLVTAIAFWLLLLNDEWVAALLLWLYPFADATLTLLRRLLRREAVWQAHRQHAYQRAVDGGMAVRRVSGLCGLYAFVAAAVAWASVGQNVSVRALGLAGVMICCAMLFAIFYRQRARS